MAAQLILTRCYRVATKINGCRGEESPFRLPGFAEEEDGSAVRERRDPPEPGALERGTLADDSSN